MSVQIDCIHMYYYTILDINDLCQQINCVIASLTTCRVRGTIKLSLKTISLIASSQVHITDVYIDAAM